MADTFYYDYNSNPSLTPTISDGNHTYYISNYQGLGAGINPVVLNGNGNTIVYVNNSCLTSLIGEHQNIYANPNPYGNDEFYMINSSASVISGYVGFNIIDLTNSSASEIVISVDNGGNGIFKNSSLGTVTSNGNTNIYLSNTNSNVIALNSGTHNIKLDGNSSAIQIGTSDGNDNISILGNSSVTGNILTGDGVDTITIDTSGYIQNINAQSGNDIIRIHAGNIGSISGEAGTDDIAIYGGSIGTVSGGADRDIISASGGTITQISGDDGDDSISISDTASVTGSVLGGSGIDEIIINTAGIVQAISGGIGADTIKLAAGTVGQISGDEGDDSIFISGGKVNTVEGNAGNDNITITNGEVGIVQGGDGADSITIDTPGAVQNVYGGADDDNIQLIAGTVDQVYGNAGNDNITIADNAEVVYSVYGDDNLDCTNQTNSNDNITVTGKVNGNIVGGCGNDTITVSGNGSVGAVYGDHTSGNCNDGSNDVITVSGNASVNSINAGNGNNSVAVKDNAVVGTIATGSGNDTVNISDNAQLTGNGEVLNTGAGDDTINLTNFRLAENSYITGGEGNDVLNALNSQFRVMAMNGSMNLNNSTADLLSNHYGAMNLNNSIARITAANTHFSGPVSNSGLIDLNNGLTNDTLHFDGGYSSNSGEIRLDSHINRNNAAADRIYINDARSSVNSSDTTVLDIIDSGTGRGSFNDTLTIIEAANGDKYSGNEFSLKNGQIIRQSYVYNLQSELVDDGAGGVKRIWSLRSGENTSPHTAGYASGLTGVSLLANAAAESVFSRLSDNRDHLKKREDNFWFKTYHSSGSVNASSTDFDFRLKGFQIGLDNASFSDDKMQVFGVLGGQGNTHSDLKNSSNMTTDQKSTYFGAYYSMMQRKENPFFFDVLGLYGNVDFNTQYLYGDDGMVREKYRGRLFSLSALTGKKFDLGKKVILEPVFGLSYTQIKHDDFIGSTGSEIKHISGDNLTAKLGLKISKQYGECGYCDTLIVPYFKFDLSKQIKGKSIVNVDSRDYENTSDGISAEFSLGVNVQKRNNTFFMQIGKSVGSKQTWKAEGGFNFTW